MVPSIRFIKGAPPKRATKNGQHQEPSGYVLGILSGNPNQWATVDIGTDTPAAVVAHRIKAKADKMGIDCEAISRDGIAYARVVSAGKS